MLELIVVVAIFVATLLVSLAAFRSTERNEALRLSGELVADLLREAESRTQTGQVFGTEFPKGGYGVSIDLARPLSFFLFGDRNENAAYDLGEEVPSVERTLMRGVRFAELTVNPAAIVFRPPEPTVFFNGVQSPSDFEIILLNEQNSARRLIRIQQFSRQIIIHDL